jgi:hypothetical protein
MLQENMPGYRGPRVRHLASEDTVSQATVSLLAESVNDPHIAPIIDSIFLGDSGGMHHCLNVVPIFFEYVSPEKVTASPKCMHGHQICAVAREAITFTWAMYGFNSGHFFSNLESRNIPFVVVLAADTRPCGRALLKQFARCPTIAVSSDDLLQTIKASPVTSTVHGYFVHSHRFLLSSTQSKFWKTQSAIIKALQLQRGMMIFIAHVHPECDITPITAFKGTLKRGGWSLSEHYVYYPNFGDSVADSAMFIIGVQRACSSSKAPIVCPTPPAVAGKKLGDFAYLPFNLREMCVSPASTDASFSQSGMVASDPCSEAAAKGRTVSKRIYNLHRVAMRQSKRRGWVPFLFRDK